MRSLDETLGAERIDLVTRRPAHRLDRPTGYVDGSLELRVIDVETGQQEVLAAGFEAIHGIGPVWSPDGERIVYQRACQRIVQIPGHEEWSRPAASSTRWSS